ncbi:transcriptional regulator, LacI family [Kushneria avicenniae]|uniref:Transcriptional regulator, LacI family n=1 Tax=Kushneria avicenniae TaxID=402385 RepID=A0A1I1GMK4_9GAMM|nr:LacI family DNA-binding transcriptional regulator [Kushneria avicenniae]SFC12676.1 transcriptional regulator, LacI family [Kushneria avicenniae]
MVSIKDVARHAETSFKTVSRVINGDQRVHPATRERVSEAIRALGYRPHSGARMMRSNQSRIIGFLSDRVTTQPHSGDILRGAQQMADAHGRLLMLFNIDADAGDDHRRRAFELLMEQRVDGLIYACDYHRDVELPTEMQQLPSLLVNGFSTAMALPALVPDERLAAQQATRLLLAEGHRRLAFLAPNSRSIATPLRTAGFHDALLEAGIAPESMPVVTACEGVPGGEETYQVESVLAQLMRDDTPPTAILCGQDRIALQLYLALARRGLHPGRDLAVVSFDDQQPISGALTPSLTTMALPHFEMGRQAMKRLLDGDARCETVTVPFSTVLGQSHRHE